MRWVGKPQPGRLYTRQDLQNMGVSLFPLAFIAFWLYQVTRHGVIPFTIFGSFIALRVLYPGFLYPLYRRWLIPRTEYAVTNRRILRLRNGRTDALDCASLPPVRIDMEQSGMGTLRFVYPRQERNGRISVPFSTDSDQHAFILYNLENAAQVMDLIRQAAAPAAANPPSNMA